MSKRSKRSWALSMRSLSSVVVVVTIMGALDDWAEDVARITAQWDTTDALGLTDDVREILERLIAADEARAQRHPTSG